MKKPGILKFKKPIVAVEIGNDWLKVLENAPSPAGRCITKARFVKLAQIKESVSLSLADIFKQLNLNSQSVITYIPRHFVTVRVLELPSLNPKEISEIVDLQISKQTPYSKVEIVSSYKLLSSRRQGYSKVMLAIVTRNIISERMLTLEKAGLKVERVALSSEGVYNWFSIAYSASLELEDDQALALVDIDSNYSDFMVICRKQLVFTRNIFIGANQLSAFPGEWQPKFIQELRRSLERYHSEERQVKILKLFLSGAAGKLENLEPAVSSELEIAVETTRPEKNIRLTKSADVFQNKNFPLVSSSAIFGACFSPGDLKFDLIPEDLRVQRLMEGRRKELTLMTILTAAMVMVLSLFLLINLYAKKAYLAQINKRIVQIEKESGAIEKMYMRIGLVENRLDAKGSSMDILSEVYRIIPKEIYFVSLDIEEKKRVTLRGQARAMSDVFEFVTVLENSPYFENVKTTYTTTKSQKGVEYAEFEIISFYQKGQ